MDPKILVFSFDENCENIITNFSIDRFISKNKKEEQKEYIDAIINKIKEIKAAVVVICTNNSKSSIKSNHYQHVLKGKIKEITNGLAYAPLLKADTTLEENVVSFKIISKNLCGIRTRIYVDKNQLYFLEEGAGEKSFTSKTSLKDEKFYTLSENGVSNNIPSIIKYGYRRITGEEEREKGYGGVMTIFEIQLRDGRKKEYIFCNYKENENKNENENKKLLKNNNKLLKKIIYNKNILSEDNKDIFIYLINTVVNKIYIKNKLDKNFFQLNRGNPIETITEKNINLFLNKNIKRLVIKNKLNTENKHILDLAISFFNKEKLEKSNIITLNKEILKKSKFFSNYIKHFFNELYLIRGLLNIEPLKIKHLKEIILLFDKLKNNNEINYVYLSTNNNNYIQMYIDDIEKNLYVLTRTYNLNSFNTEEYNVIPKKDGENKKEKIDSITHLKKILDNRFIQNQLKILMDDKDFVLYFLEKIINKIKHNSQLYEPRGDIIFMENSPNNSTEYYKEERNRKRQRQNYSEEQNYNEENHTFENTEITDKTKTSILLKIMGIEINNNKTKIIDYKDEIEKSFRTLARKYHPNKGGNNEKFKKLGSCRNILIKRAGESWYKNNINQ